MKKSKITDKKKKSTTAESINVFWDISPNWNKLSYEKKLEYYWRYQWLDSERVFDIEVE